VPAADPDVMEVDPDDVMEVDSADVTEVEEPPAPTPEAAPPSPEPAAPAPVASMTPESGSLDLGVPDPEPPPESDAEPPLAASSPVDEVPEPEAPEIDLAGNPDDAV